MENKSTKALKTLELAMSEARIGNAKAAATAAYRAGHLANSAGVTCDYLDEQTGAGTSAYDSAVWTAVVDGWYDASERAAA